MKGGDIYSRVIYCSQHQNDPIRTTQHMPFLSLELLIHRIGSNVGVKPIVASSHGEILRPAVLVDRLSSTSMRRPCGKCFGSLRKKDSISYPGSGHQPPCVPVAAPPRLVLLITTSDKHSIGCHPAKIRLLDSIKGPCTPIDRTQTAGTWKGIGQHVYAGAIIAKPRTIT